MVKSRNWSCVCLYNQVIPMPSSPPAPIPASYSTSSNTFLTFFFFVLLFDAVELVKGEVDADFFSPFRFNTALYTFSASSSGRTP
eukprot:CCRYP_009233-RA/>CCRYP_009233-RA protein AED:0.43 eAED:0.66 QI:325/0/0.5/1/0/0/2/0/84